jgi:hypothetical protein
VARAERRLSRQARGYVESLALSFRER